MTSLAYALSLLFIRPSPASLKGAELTFLENFKSVKATLFVGLSLLLIFLLTSDFNFLRVNERIYADWTLRGGWATQNIWPLQSITSLFIHFNLLHLIANVSGLALASVYERRVGSRRFLIVLIVASLASIPSAFFYPDECVISGISGGIFGLAAAYFADHEKITAKEWLLSVVYFFSIIAALSMESVFLESKNTDMVFQDDHIGHIMGATGGLIFCRLFPLRARNAEGDK